jgi:hypothetical protein
MPTSAIQSVAIALRSTADPRVVAAALTGCSLNFGPTAKQFRASGAGLIIAGVLLTALVVGFFMVLCHRKKQRTFMVGQPPPGVVGMTYMNPTQQPMPMAPPMYAPQYAQQQQPQYAQPGYAQPQAQYVQPQPYGQQPQYAQPQQYGQARAGCAVLARAWEARR